MRNLYNKFPLLVAVAFVAAIASFFGEWIDAQKISFVAYSYFLISLCFVRCYLFCLAAWGVFLFYKKSISFVAEVLFFLPVILQAALLLRGIPFNTIMLYSRIATVVQLAAVIFLFSKAMILFRKKLQNENCEETILYDFKKLSKREKEVAELILAGKKTEQIAEELFISAATVKSHIQNIFKKYGVKSRMEFANKVK